VICPGTTTRRGRPCRRAAGPSGFCEAHDPETVERRRQIMIRANASAPRKPKTLRTAEACYEELERELRAVRSNAEISVKERVTAVVQLVEAARKLRPVALEEGAVDALAREVRSLLPETEETEGAAANAPGPVDP
jgi:hypothetical protein